MAVFPRRYGIYFADLDPTVGGELRKVRPVVVVSQNERNRFLDTVVVCPLTSTLHPQWRSRLQIPCAGKTAEIAVDQIRTISPKFPGSDKAQLIVRIWIFQLSEVPGTGNVSMRSAALR